MKKKVSEELDALRMENFALRVTLTKTLQILLPIASFVITQHAYLYMEILDLSFWTPKIMITLLLSSLISCFFLVYSYAIVMNGLSAQLYSRELQKLNSIKEDYIRYKFVTNLSLESMLLGLAMVNGIYLASWVTCAFGLFRYFPGITSYIISTVIACTGSLTISEYIFGCED